MSALVMASNACWYLTVVHDQRGRAWMHDKPVTLLTLEGLVNLVSVPAFFFLLLPFYFPLISVLDAC